MLTYVFLSEFEVLKCVYYLLALIDEDVLETAYNEITITIEDK